MRTRPLVVSFVSSALSFIACSSDVGSTEPSSASSMSAADIALPTAGAGVLHDTGDTEDDTYSFQTGSAAVDPGQERYLCFAKTLDEDLVINQYSHATQVQVHHMIFVRTLAPEPDGFSECDTLFRTTWDPLFVTGAGTSTLAFPDNAGHTLTKGTQLLVQLHMLNSTTQTIDEPVEIKMHRSSVANPIPVATYTFGTLQLNVPANQASEVQSGCQVDEDLQLIAGFPHMHRMGRKLRFEAGDSQDSMQTKFLRDPYDFDDQHMEQFDIHLSPGDNTRVTCDYENTTPNDVTFGESASNEMCFFVAFALNRKQISGCIQ